MSLCSSVSSKSTRQVYGRVGGVGAFLLPLVLVGGLAFDNGGFDPVSWGWGTLLPLLVVGVSLVVGAARRPGRLGLWFVGLISAFAAWAWLSVAWSDDVSRSVLDGERLLVYVAAAGAFLLVERLRIEPFLLGLLAAICGVAAWALWLRAFGGSGSYDVASVSAGATRRLAAPVGYSNGLGALAAIGIVLAIALAARLRRPLLAAPVLALAPVLYFTYSRGAWLALAAGAIAAVAVSRPRMPRPVLVAVAVAVLGAVTLGLVRVGGPAGFVRKFSGAAPTVEADENRRLFTLAGSSRAQYWHVAWETYEENPWLGSGAGSFQRRWLRSRPAPLPVLDAHSLYLETLAELGPLGLALLALGLVLPGVAAVASRDEPLVPAAFGGYVAFAVHAAQDWDWELPAVTLAGIGCGVALLALTAREPRRSFTRGERAAAVAATVALALVAAAAVAGNAAVATARSALEADEADRAVRNARRAQRLVPWSPEPWRLHAEGLLARGAIEGAQRELRKAVEKDPGDWESWADLALVASDGARREAAARARRLNPLEQSEPRAS